MGRAAGTRGRESRSRPPADRPPAPSTLGSMDASLSGGRRLARIGLAAAAAFVTVNIWTGAPLLALWVGSRAAGPSGLSMTAVFVVVMVLLVLVLLLVAALSRLNERYDRLVGRTAERRVSPWMRDRKSTRLNSSHE